MPISSQFTDDEVESIRGMCRVPNTTSSIADLVSRLDALNAAQVINTQTDIAEWKKVEYGTEKSKGGIKGTDYDIVRNRTWLRDKLRERLDLPALPAPLGADQMGFIGVTLPGWWGCSDDELSQS